MRYCGYTKEELKNCHKIGKRIVCWGTGKNASKCIQELRFENNIVFFVDSNEEKWGDTFQEWEIKNPEILKGELDVIVVLTMKNCWRLLERLMQEQNDGIEVCCFELLSDAKKEILSIDDAWYYSRMIVPALERYRQNLLDDNVAEKEINSLITEKEIQLSKKTDGKYPLVLPRIVLLVTDKCSLNCNGCCAFMDKFKSPQHVEIDKMLTGVKKLFDAVDGCVNIQLAGGEVFLYPHVEVLLDYLLDEPKCEKIGLITNGTIVPKESLLEKMANPKIFIEMSDYGLIERQAKVITKFEEHNLNFKVFAEQTWFDYGDPEIKIEKSFDELRREYAGCRDGLYCKPFDGERFYKCGRSARMQHIGVKGFNYENDSCTVNEVNLRDSIKALYLADYAEACDYCTIMSGNAKKIPVGIQKNETMKKSEYIIISRNELQQIKNSQK